MALSMKATVFLGGGRITSALVAGLRLAGYEQGIVVYDRNPEKMRALRRETRVQIARDLKSALLRAEMLIVAVRPASVAEILDKIAACGIPAPRLCVSLAAGIPLRKLLGMMGRPTRWVRAMPGPVCRVGRGLTALSFERGVANSERKHVRDFFAHVGAVVEIPESQFDAFTAAYSSSHGYHALATLAKAGQRAGMGRATAMTAAAEADIHFADLWHDWCLLVPVLKRRASPWRVRFLRYLSHHPTRYESVTILRCNAFAKLRKVWPAGHTCNGNSDTQGGSTQHADQGGDSG